MKTNGSIILLELFTFTVILHFFSELAVKQVTSRAATFFFCGLGRDDQGKNFHI